MAYRFEQVHFESFKETSVEQFPHKSIYITRDWYDFLIQDSHIKPVILRIFRNDQEIGYFYGGEVTKFGIRIIGSPFAGWSTCWMGFELLEGENKYDILDPLWQYLSKTLHYMYFEITDRDFEQDEVVRRGYRYETGTTLELRIDRSNEELFKVFKTDCRNFIRQFERRGATVEVAKPDEVFASEVYDQLCDVFAKQGLKPSWSTQKIETMMYTLGKTDKLLCLRVRNPEGKSIASSIFAGFNDKCFFLADASYREYQHYRPNEYMIWTAIKYWRDRGCMVFDMVGDRSYKRKFAPTPENYCTLYFARPAILINMRNLAKQVYWMLKRK